MKIVMTSINPLFPDRVMGGAPKQLKQIAQFIASLGNQVRVLSTIREDSQQPFQWDHGVEVIPVFRFKQPFPQPYDVPAYDIANAFADAAKELASADRYYMHDGELLFPPLYDLLPTVTSLRDNVYPETLLGGFLFRGDGLIAISEYSRRYYLGTFGRFFPELGDRIQVIRNGIDWDQYRPTKPLEILKRIPVRPKIDNIILHPHRPEPAKGLRQTIEVVERLVRLHQIPNLKVLVPTGMEASDSQLARGFLEQMRDLIRDRGLQSHFLFHEWIPDQLMPQYYSLGSLTLSLGHFVESFGNAVYESMGCGTPAIVSRVSTHRELMPDSLLAKVHFDDSKQAASLAAEIIRNRDRTSSEALGYLRETFDVEAQLTAYARAILGARKGGQMRAELLPPAEGTRYQLAPWCYLWEGGIYHDFRATHAEPVGLRGLLQEFPNGGTRAQMSSSCASAAIFEAACRDGYLVPWTEPNVGMAAA